MDSAIGIFATRERAEEALLRLLKEHVPEDRIVFLTGSEKDVEQVGTRMSSNESRAGDMAVPRLHSGSLTPGSSTVFALEFAPANVSCSAVARPILSAGTSSHFASLVGSPSSQDTEFFRRVLDDGQSVIIVRTNSTAAAAAACRIFDDLAWHMRRSGATQTSVIFRRIPGGALAEFTGKIALTDGTALLRESIRNFLNFGYKLILLDLERVDYVDSAGIGELVRSHATVRSHGGQLKLVRPSAGVLRLLQMTKLNKVFEIAPDQATALRHSA